MDGRPLLWWGTILLGLGCTASQHTTPPSKPHSFFVAGHVYGNQAHAEQSLAPYPSFVAEVRQMASEGITEGILLGDVVYHATEERYAALAAEMADFGGTWKIAPGNHDFDWEKGVALPGPFDERHGDRFQVWTRGGDVYAVFDSNEGHWDLAQEQLDALRDTLAEKDGLRNVFAFVHNVLWWESAADSPYHFPTPNSLWNRLDTLRFHSEVLPWLQSLDCPVYFFAGDTGNACNGRALTSHRAQNVHLITTGMGCPTESNLLVVRVGGQGQVSIEVRGLGNSSLGQLEDYRY